jgi:hypothetical protein
MSVQERVEAMEIFSDTLRVQALELSDLDTSALSMSEGYVKMAVDAIEEATSKWIPQLVALMSTVLDDDDDEPLQADSSKDPEEADDAAIVIQHQRRTQQKRKTSNQEDHEHSRREEEQNGSPNNHQNRTPRFLKNHFGPKFDHVFKNHHAMLNGDERHMKKLFSSLKATHDRHAGDSNTCSETHARRTAEQDPDVFKLDQCKQLAECTSRMSRYDLIVYFYSDDIDPLTGKVDENIFQFDEQYLWFKVEQIEKFTKALVTKFEKNEGLDGVIDINYTVDGYCDQLLEEFHRTVEFGDVLHWQGGLVAQVCLAEGTTVYLNLAEIHTKIDPVLPHQWAVFYNEFSSRNSLADEVAYEMVTCARELLEFNGDLDSDPFSGRSIPLRVIGQNKHGQIPLYGDGDYKFAVLDRPWLWDDRHPNPIYEYSSLVNQGVYQVVYEQTLCSIIACSWEFDYNEDLFDTSCDNYDGPGCNAGQTNIQYGPRVGTTTKEQFPSCGIHWEKSGISQCYDFDEEKQRELGPEEYGWLRGSEGRPCERECRLNRKEDYYNAITQAFELVFGDRPSVGYICGIKRAVVDHGKNLPGECCISAPFQSETNWGNAVSLELESDSS